MLKAPETAEGLEGEAGRRTSRSPQRMTERKMSSKQQGMARPVADPARSGSTEWSSKSVSPAATWDQLCPHRAASTPRGHPR